MGVFNKTFVDCDHCGKEYCIDETGECGLPISEMLPLGWQFEDGSIKCLGCIEEKSIDKVLNVLRELYDFSTTNLQHEQRSQNAFAAALQLLKRYGK